MSRIILHMKMRWSANGFASRIANGWKWGSKVGKTILPCSVACSRCCRWRRWILSDGTDYLVTDVEPAELYRASDGSNVGGISSQNEGSLTFPASMVTEY